MAFHSVRFSLCMLLTGCATSQPIVDTDGVDLNKYYADLERCQHYQDQAKSNWQSDALGGVVVGGLLGAIGGDAGDALEGAAVGSVIGGTGSLGHDAERKDHIIRECLRQRGYKVLD